MWIELNELEQRIARHLAKKRHETDRQLGISNRRIGPQSDDDTDLEGIGAELAYCKAVNVYPDLATDYKSLPTEDAITRDGYRVDVKSTTYERGHLLATLGKAGNPADIYVLVVGRFPRYRIAGFMHVDELLQEERIKDLSHGPGYAARQDELEPM